MSSRDDILDESSMWTFRTNVADTPITENLQERAGGFPADCC